MTMLNNNISEANGDKIMGDIINPVAGNSFIELAEARDTRIFVEYKVLNPVF